MSAEETFKVQAAKDMNPNRRVVNTFDAFCLIEAAQESSKFRKPGKKFFYRYVWNTCVYLFFLLKGLFTFQEEGVQHELVQTLSRWYFEEAKEQDVNWKTL